MPQWAMASPFLPFSWSTKSSVTAAMGGSNCVSFKGERTEARVRPVWLKPFCWNWILDSRNGRPHGLGPRNGNIGCFGPLEWKIDSKV